VPGEGDINLPDSASGPQIQIGQPCLPEHRTIACEAGNGDRERLPQTRKSGEGRAPVRSVRTVLRPLS
jgi:hypothetical protein